MTVCQQSLEGKLTLKKWFCKRLRDTREVKLHNQNEMKTFKEATKYNFKRSVHFCKILNSKLYLCKLNFTPKMLKLNLY